MQYRVLTPIKQNGKVVAAGELIELPEVEALPLIESQCLEPAHKPFSVTRLHPMIQGK